MFLVRHPLVRHIAQQLVWGTYDAPGALVATFRVAEDLTYADVEDELFTPPPGAAIGIAHPLDLGELVGRWSGVEMPAGKVAGLTRRGWRRGEPWDAGIEMYIARPLPGRRAVIAYITPGICAGSVAESPDQSFSGIVISRDGQAYYRPTSESSDPFGTLDPVTASEILRDLTEVTAQ